jgi:hypothetical protein
LGISQAAFVSDPRDDLLLLAIYDSLNLYQSNWNKSSKISDLYYRQSRAQNTLDTVYDPRGWARHKVTQADWESYQSSILGNLGIHLGAVKDV